jgi:SpoVK/Ycf46/Vps4 family AAA+-type ATPase
MSPGTVGKDKVKKDRLLYYLKNAFDSIGHIYEEDMFTLMLKYFSPEFKRKLFKDCVAYAGNMKLDVEYIVNSYQDGTSDLHETLTDLYRRWQLRKKFQKNCIRELIMVGDICVMNKQSNQCQLMQMKTMFSLSKVEMAILGLFYDVATNQSITDLADALNEYLAVKTTRFGSNLNEKTMAVMLNLNRLEVQKVLKTTAPLIKFGILDNDREITDEIMAFLEGFNERPMLQHYFSLYDGAVIALKHHFVKQQDIDILCELHRQRTRSQGINILLYGVPGTGKTEFVRSLSRNLHADLYQVHSIDSTDDRDEEKDVNHFRIRAFAACQNTINTQKTIILMDEADSLINSIPRFFMLKNTMDKGQINSLLDDSRAFTIWIANHTDGMDESTRRRFNYAIKFERLGIRERQKIWQYKIKQYELQNVLPAAEATDFAERYELNAGGIDTALRNFAALSKVDRTKIPQFAKLEQMLTSYQTLVSGKRPVKRQNTRANYMLEGLNVDSDMKRVLDTLDGFNRCWLEGADDMPGDNLNLFLYGPPGTGKTEFARYVARRLKRRLIVKRGSDLLSPYIGVTEQLICEAFEQAEREQAILFIDEADSFLFTRENAGRSWELSQVNELLTNMENFTGIFIAATNYKESIDSAAMRRFSIKMKFDYLTAQGNLVFYRRFFSPWLKKRLSKSEQTQLMSIEFLTPGDFKVVFQNYQLSKSDKIFHIDMIQSLQNEVSIRKKTAGDWGFQS